MSGATTLSTAEQLTVRLKKCFRGESQFALDVELAVAPGFTILFGASGAGKTSLLDCIAGLQTPDDGAIAIGEAILFDSVSRVNLPPRRRAVAYLLQSLALFPHMTVEQNVQYGLAALSTRDRDARSGEVLESFRIAALVERRVRDQHVRLPHHLGLQPTRVAQSHGHPIKRDVGNPRIAKVGQPGQAIPTAQTPTK